MGGGFQVVTAPLPLPQPGYAESYITPDTLKEDVGYQGVPGISPAASLENREYRFPAIALTL